MKKEKKRFLPNLINDLIFTAVDDIIPKLPHVMLTTDFPTFSYRFFGRAPPTLGKVNGNFSFAMKWFALSALVSFMFVRSVCVGAASLQPNSAKYCLILSSVSRGGDSFS